MGSRWVILDIGGVLEITPKTGWVARWQQRLGLAAGAVGRQSGRRRTPRLSSALDDGLGWVAYARRDWAEYLAARAEESDREAADEKSGRLKNN